jgi:hypothetical protein
MEKKFDFLHIFNGTNRINNTMSYKHNCPDIKRLFKNLKMKGFTVERRNNGIKIIPPTSVGTKPYFTHGTSSAYHNLRRDFASMYRIDITSNCDLRSDPLYTMGITA